MVKVKASVARKLGWYALGRLFPPEAPPPGLPRVLKSFSYCLIPIPGSGVFCFNQR